MGGNRVYPYLAISVRVFRRGVAAFGAEMVPGAAFNVTLFLPSFFQLFFGNLFCPFFKAFWVISVPRRCVVVALTPIIWISLSRFIWVVGFFWAGVVG
jgi:hypothetical protein